MNIKNNSKRIFFIFIFLFLYIISYAEDRENLPLDLPRTPVSSIYGYYFPSLDLSSPYGFYNNFGFTGIIQNIFVTGPNLNFGYGYYHRIQNNTVLSNGSEVTENPEYKWQSQDILNFYANYSFLYFCQINAELNYLMNRMIDKEAAYDYYNYNNLNVNLSFVYDRRYSSLQQWVMGQLFIYPEEGFLLSIGNSHSFIKNTIDNSNYNINSIFFKSQFFFHSFKRVVFVLDLSGQSLLQSNKYWAFSPVANVTGSYDIPCDYFLKGSLEMRIMFPGGIFWDSPAFWYFNSYSFKFSGGFILGYNASYAGYFEGNYNNFLHSLYLTPMIMIRMNGNLLTVIRFDLAIASSKDFQYVLSVNIGNVGGTPSSIWKKGF